MVKSKKKAEEKVKENPNQNPSPNELGVRIDPAMTGIIMSPAGEPAPTVVTEDGKKVQVGQVEPEQLAEQEREQRLQQQLAKAVHPILGTVFESNITKYKGRRTEFLTLPMKLTQQARYPFRSDSHKKMKVRITLVEDGSKLIVEKA